MTTPTTPATPLVRDATTRVLTPRVLIAIVITVLAWASAFIVIRGTAPYFSGGALALGRLLVGTVVLGVVVLAGRRWMRPTAREWIYIAVYGAVWFGGYNVALNIAEHTLDAGTTAMLVNFAPILIAIGGAVFLREGFPKWLAIGAGVALVGAVLIGVASGGSLSDGAGVLFCLLAAVAYAVGVLFQKPALRRLPAAQVTWLGCAVGLVVCLPFSGDLIAQLPHAPASGVLGVVYLGAIPTAVAFSTWAYALSRVPAGQLGVSTYIVPPLAIIFGLLVFNEIPVPFAIVGGILCLVGVGLSRRRARPVPALPESLAE
ncbi:MAG TPA: DMT family transporter [Galbitalea sp.]|jgi:drug/metabolite transporter (DMT)-like permease